MRLATSPAICTQVTSAPPGVRSQSALRSFSDEALSSAAFRKRPELYQRFFTSPSAGDLLECTLKTFMNTLTLIASRSRYGSRDRSTATTRPSAGETTECESPGAARGGSRKNCSTKSAASQNGTDHQPASQVATSAAPSIDATYGQPSFAMMG